MQIHFQADLTRDSRVVVAGIGADLSTVGGNANVLFTVAGSGVGYDVAGVTAPAGGEAGRWRVDLAAPYQGDTAAGVESVLHLTFSSTGMAYPALGDTEWTAIAGRRSRRTDPHDPRLRQIAREVDNIAALRASPVPVAGADSGVVRTAGYRQAGDGGANTFRWDAASTLDDNGGTVLACAANAAGPGRFVAINHRAGEVNVRQWGAHPTLATPAQNQAAFQTAHDSLPILYDPAVSATAPYLTPSGRQPRVGTVHVPPGRYVLGGAFLPYSAVAVRGDGWRQTALVLEDGVFTDPAAPTWFVCFERSVGVDQNNHFGARWTGIGIDAGNGAGKNPGGAGLCMSGAQGTELDGAMISGFGTMGLDFHGVHLGTVWVGGGGTALGPAVVLHGDSCTADALSVEHVNYDHVKAAYWNDAVPPYMVLVGPNNTINSLQFEGATTNGPVVYLQLGGDARQTVIQNLSVNTTPDGQAAATQLVVFDSGRNPGLRIGAIYARLGVPTFVTDTANGYRGNPESYDSATFAGIVGGRLGRFDRLEIGTEMVWRSGIREAGSADASHDFTLPPAGQVYGTRIYEVEIHVTSFDGLGWWRLVYRSGIHATDSRSVSELASVESVPIALTGSFPRSPLGFALDTPDASTLRVTVNGPADGSGAACIVRVIDRN